MLQLPSGRVSRLQSSQQSHSEIATDCGFVSRATTINNMLRMVFSAIHRGCNGSRSAKPNRSRKNQRPSKLQRQTIHSFCCKGEGQVPYTQPSVELPDTSIKQGQVGNKLCASPSKAVEAVLQASSAENTELETIYIALEPTGPPEVNYKIQYVVEYIGL